MENLTLFIKVWGPWDFSATVEFNLIEVVLS